SATRSLSSIHKTDLTSASTEASYNRTQAINLYKRLTGVTPNLNSPLIQEMKNYIDQGDAFSAGYIASSQSGFYNVTVRDFAVKLSNINHTVRAPMNDLAATVIGSVRDDISAVQLLTENFYYSAEETEGVPSDIENDLVRSNNHYQFLEDEGYDYSVVLQRREGQKIIDESGAVVDLPDSSGLLTSRAFMAAHADMGTNRRIIEFTFKTFMCTPINEWANSSNPDNRIGPDIGRFPKNDYDNKCKSCHSGMDSLRPATAHFDFADGFIKYNYTYTNDPNPDDPSQLNVPVPDDEQKVPYKFRRASDNFPGGFRVFNDRWINYADPIQFGFRTSNQGNGMKGLGELIAYSEKYSECMVQRVFESVCRRDVEVEDRALIRDLTVDFENDNHNLRNLFINVAIQPQCIGLEI
ncbi:MAG: DUF1585 domain-containing protein, partial [Bdellovibrionales bacterium]|nr:DUF1585 domain-containing protein [Bdellovibrionales bacterium]